MRTRFLQLTVFLAFVLILAGGASAQSDGSVLFPDRRGDKSDEESQAYKDMLAKVQSERDKKDHEEMLKHGEEALAIADDLEKALAGSPKLKTEDKKRLESLEKLATKIRDELGGGDDGEVIAAKNDVPHTTAQAFDDLHASTQNLVDELKKTTRYSISVIAIQCTNAVIRSARLLRLRN